MSPPSDRSPQTPDARGPIALASLPESMRGRLTLVVPGTIDLEATARCHFTQAQWAHPPLTAEENRARTRPLSGARFRGVVAEAAPTPGVLRLDWTTLVHGPFPLSAQEASELGAPGDQVAYPIEEDARSMPSPLPGDAPAGPPVGAWARAVAARWGGAVVTADGTVLHPDPGNVVGLAHFTASVLSEKDALAAVRTAFPSARAEAPADAATLFAVLAPSSYDGEVEVRASRATALPLALASLPWRDYGPVRIDVHWRPPADQAESGGRLNAMARDRMAPFVARIALALHAAAQGTVLTRDGFGIGEDELRHRAGMRHRT